MPSRSFDSGSATFSKKTYLSLAFAQDDGTFLRMLLCLAASSLPNHPYRFLTARGDAQPLDAKTFPAQQILQSPRRVPHAVEKPERIAHGNKALAREFKRLLRFPLRQSEHGGDSPHFTQGHFRRMNPVLEPEMRQRCREPASRFDIVVLGKDGLQGSGNFTGIFCRHRREMRAREHDISRPQDRAKKPDRRRRWKVGK